SFTVPPWPDPPAPPLRPIRISSESFRLAAEGDMPYRRCSDLEQFPLLMAKQSVDLGDLLVCQLLELLLGAIELVRGDLAVFLQPFELVTRRSADVAHGDSSLFGSVLHDFHELFPPLLVELG